jgi:hypothetical protein
MIFGCKVVSMYEMWDVQGRCVKRTFRGKEAGKGIWLINVV